METNGQVGMPPLMGKPTKQQTNVLNWAMIGMYLAPVVLQLITAIKDLTSKDKKPSE